MTGWQGKVVYLTPFLDFCGCFVKSHTLIQPGLYLAVSGSVLPIADIRGVDSLNYSKGEKLLRNKVAATYRLVDIYGWSHGFSTLITVGEMFSGPPS